LIFEKISFYIDCFHHHEIEQVISILNHILPLSLVQRILSPLCGKSTSQTWTSDFVLTQMNHTCESSTGASSKTWKDQEIHPYYYIIDPIDGTKGFLRQAQFSIGLGVMDKRTGYCVASFIACPNIEELKLLGTLPNGNKSTENQLKFYILILINTY
jgi:hypothetical protein